METSQEDVRRYPGLAYTYEEAATHMLMERVATITREQGDGRHIAPIEAKDRSHHGPQQQTTATDTTAQMAELEQFATHLLKEIRKEIRKEMSRHHVPSERNSEARVAELYNRASRRLGSYEDDGGDDALAHRETADASTQYEENDNKDDDNDDDNDNVNGDNDGDGDGLYPNSETGMPADGDSDSRISGSTAYERQSVEGLVEEDDEADDEAESYPGPAPGSSFWLLCHVE